MSDRGDRGEVDVGDDRLPAGLRLLVDERAALAASGRLGPAASGRGAARRRRLADLAERALQDLWATAGAPPEGVALAAVGSLARHEAGPASDLDLVLLHEARAGADLPDELAQRLWYPVWDAGVRLDHSVRTPAQCRDVGAADLSAAVGLLDLRHIAGDEVLVAGVRATLAHDWRAHARSRLPELVADVSARHQRRGDLAHLLEPDVKESRGGLRDMTVVRALTAAWLADRPRGGLDAAYELLLDVRDALHVATGRSRERLIQQEHGAVAALLGYGDATSMQRAVSDAGRLVALALDSTSRRAGQSQRARAPRAGPRRPVLTPLGHGLYEHDGEVVVGRGADVADPLFAVRAARVAATTGVPLSPTTLDSLVSRVPAPARPWPEAATGVFGELLAAGEPLIDTWEALTVSGVVEAWLPCWSDIRSLPQRNPVHRHTVDRHCLQTVVECRPLLTATRRPDVLLVAALLHDIGKAHGTTDHAQVGAAPARAAAEGLGFDGADAARVERLVAEHLTLIDLATHHDPDDPATVERLCAAVAHDPDLLDLLRALTEADARAAGPAAWTSWRAGLVDDLVARAHRHLSDGPGGVADFGGPGRPFEAGTATTTPPPDGRLDGHESENLGDRGGHGGPRVAVIDAAAADVVIEVVATDRPGLFVDTVEVFTAHGLSISGADLRTDDAVARNRWHVRHPGGRPIEADALRRALAGREGGAPRRSVRRPPVTPDAPAAHVRLAAGERGGVVLELRALDRAGLLQDVGRALADVGVAVRAARIATRAGVAVDLLHVVYPDGGELGAERLGAVSEHVRAVVQPG